MAKLATARRGIATRVKGRVVAKAAPRRTKPARAKRSAKALPTEDLKPIKERLSARDIIEDVADAVFGSEEDSTPNMNPIRTVKAVIAAYEEIAMRCMMPRGVGEFAFGKLAIFKTRKMPAKSIPARKAGMYPNLFKKGKDGKPLMEHRDAKPAQRKEAYTKPRILAKKMLKDIVKG